MERKERLVIAKVTGMKLSEFMEKEIFKPLGMKDTAFLVPEEKRNRLATMYMKDSTDGKVVKASEQKLKSILQREIIEGSSFEAGGSGLYSTIDDYAQFAQILDLCQYRGHKKSIFLCSLNSFILHLLRCFVSKCAVNPFSVIPGFYILKDG